MFSAYHMFHDIEISTIYSKNVKYYKGFYIYIYQFFFGMLSV
jgi:hypothetical protein